MNYIAYTARFLYRIKWWLILAPIIVALAVFFKMGAQPRNYKSMTTVYTGIVSGYDITTTEGTRQDWNIINNAMDNLINIILSQTTLKNVSMRLYAQGLTHLDPDNDNQYLTARTSRYLLNRTPRRSWTSWTAPPRRRRLKTCADSKRPTTTTTYTACSTGTRPTTAIRR